MIIESLDLSGSLSKTRMHVDGRLRRERWRFEVHCVCVPTWPEWQEKCRPLIQRYRGTMVLMYIQAYLDRRLIE